MLTRLVARLGGFALSAVGGLLGWAGAGECIRFFTGRHAGQVRTCFCLRCVLEYLGSSQRGYTEKGNEMSNEIVTLVVELRNYETGEFLGEPIYECAGMTKFEEFHAWYEKELTKGRNALLKGYALNNPVPVRTMVVVK